MTPESTTPESTTPEGVTSKDRSEALTAALLELEHHVASAGWDVAPRLFALVETDVLAATEPELVAALGLRTTAQGAAPGALTAVEQDTFVATGDLLDDLAALEWPDGVFGVAVAAVRMFLPAGAEVDLPEDPTEAAALVAEHPASEEIRVVVGADRAGTRHGVARLRSRPDDLLGGADLVPGLASALAHTLA